jgi:putative DNA primase/helicase
LARATERVFVVEGEKDAGRLIDSGLLATSNAGGAGKWSASHSESLVGREVVILPDNDETGRKHARQVALSLTGTAASIRIVEIPTSIAKGDVSDWLDASGSIEELQRLADSACEWSHDTEPWPKLRPLDDTALPGFPTYVLPDVLRNWVEAEAVATQTPADLAGLLSLAVVASCIARKVVVEPRPGWQEPTNLFVAVVLGPGNRKSAVFADATRPLREIEERLIEEARPAVAIQESEKRQLEARLKQLEKAAANGCGESMKGAGELAAQLAILPPPGLPRLLVDDVTVEKLGIILSQQGGRLASMSAEGNVFDLMAGTYSKNGGAQFDAYLKGHAGDDLLIDRVSRPSLRVERPALTCAYAIQPAVVDELAANAAFRGRGLLARFLYAIPRSQLGERQIAPPPVMPEISENYRQAVLRLSELKYDFILTLDPDAEVEFMKWEQSIESMLADGGELETICDWGAKLAGATLRIAAVLHCLERIPEIPINSQTIATSAIIAEYLIAHAERVLSMMNATTNQVAEDCRYVLRWINRHQPPTFTKTELHHHGKRRFPAVEDLEPALTELISRGYLRLIPAEATGPGRPASPKFEVNPAVFNF